MPPKPKAEAERQKALAAASMSTSTSEADATRNLLPAATLEEEEELDEAGQRTKRKRERLRGLAEDAAWEHFGHRAAVAMPSFRLLRRAEMGDITLPMLRRWRVGMGALLPSWLGESLAGLVVVYAGWLCQLTVRLAIAARDGEHSAQSMAFR